MVGYTQKLSAPGYKQVYSSLPGPEGPQGPSGDLISVAGIQASEAIAAKDFVNVYNDGSDNLRVRKADATDPAKFANGFAPAAIANGAAGTIAFVGLNSATVVTPKAVVYLSDTLPGSYSATPPSVAGRIVQALGPALPGAGIPFTPQPFTVAP